MPRSTSVVGAALAWLALALPPGVAAAQERPADVRGRVVSATDGQTLGLVRVALRGTPFTAVTADDGAFRFPTVPPGDYVLETTAVGYYAITRAITLGAGEVTALEVALAPSTVTFATSAAVTADAFDTPTAGAAAFTLTGHEVANLASVLADDPLRAVQSLPGVTSNDDFSSEFSVRGAPFARVGVYLDGVLLHAPFHTTDGVAANGSLSVFSGDLADDVTLYQGAWPVRFGDRTAGVLNVETRSGTRDAVRTQVSASASNAAALAEGPFGSRRQGAWVVAVRKSYLRYILDRVDFGDQPPLAFAFDDVQARVDYDLGPKAAVSVNVLDGASSVDRSRYRDELGPNTVMTSGFHFTLLNLGLRYATPRLLLSTHAAWSREAGDVGNRDAVPLSNARHQEATVRSDVTWQAAPRAAVEAGADLRYLRDRGAARQFVYAPAPTPVDDVFAGTGWEGGAYAQLSGSAGPARLAAGVRRDRHSVSGVAVTSPYLSASWTLAPATRVEVDWGRYAQYPELAQSFSRFGSTALRPERATHYDVLLEERLGARTRFRVEAYDRHDRDLLARSALDPRVSAAGAVVDADPAAPWRNAQRGSARGVQATVQRRTANGLTGWIAYAYDRAVVRDDTIDGPFPSDDDQRHTATVYLSRRVTPSVNVSGHVSVGSGMPLPGFYRRDGDGYALDRSRNQLRAPIYQRTDLRINKAYVRTRFTATLFAEVVNATNHTNRDFDSPGPYDPATGRSTPVFYSMFPVLPSVGVVMTLGRPGLDPKS